MHSRHHIASRPVSPPRVLRRTAVHVDAAAAVFMARSRASMTMWITFKKFTVKCTHHDQLNWLLALCAHAGAGAFACVTTTAAAADVAIDCSRLGMRATPSACTRSRYRCGRCLNARGRRSRPGTGVVRVACPPPRLLQVDLKQRLHGCTQATSTLAWER